MHQTRPIYIMQGWKDDGDEDFDVAPVVRSLLYKDSAFRNNDAVPTPLTVI